MMSPNIRVSARSRVKDCTTITLASASCAVPARLELQVSTWRCPSSVCWITSVVTVENTITSTISVSASFQLSKMVSGSRIDDGEQRRELVPEEAQPDREHSVRARNHDLDEASGMGVAMKRQRQIQDMRVEPPHDVQAVAMRHPLALQRDRHGGEDAGDADRDPDQQQMDRLLPHHRPRHRIRVRQKLDDAPEQQGIQKTQCRGREIRETEQDRGTPVLAQDREYPAVNPQKAHGSFRKSFTSGGRMTAKGFARQPRFPPPIVAELGQIPRHA